MHLIPFNDETARWARVVLRAACSTGEVKISAQRHARRRRARPGRDPPRHLGHHRVRIGAAALRRWCCGRMGLRGELGRVSASPARSAPMITPGVGEDLGAVGSAWPAALRAGLGSGRRPPSDDCAGCPVTIWSETASPDLAAAAARTDRGHEVGLVPVGAIEQHGPHLPVGTDTIVASTLCADAGAMTDSLVLPPISLGVSYGHGTVLAGTLSLTPDLLVATVATSDVRWASVSGRALLRQRQRPPATPASLRRSPPTRSRPLAPQLRVGTLDWWAADPWVLAEVTADGADLHANRAETAIMLAIAPHLVHPRTARCAADDPDRSDGLTFRLHRAPALVTQRGDRATAGGDAPSPVPSCSAASWRRHRRADRAGPGRGASRSASPRSRTSPF